MDNQLHVVVNADVTSGGEGLAALRYAQEVSKRNCMVTLLSTWAAKKQAEPVALRSRFEQQLIASRKYGFINIFYQYKIIWNLCQKKSFDLIHLHGMWSPILCIAAFIAYRRNIPLIISPHGCLEPWALQNKYFKKQLAMKVYQGAVLRSASLLVATAEQELLSLRHLGLQQPIALIPNGVDVCNIRQVESQNNIKTFLFLSRVHPKKGLLDLVEAWAIVRQPGWRIVIAGGDEEGYRARVESLIIEKGLESEFEFSGFVSGTRKQSCFEQADVFILPTYSENFGIAIAEALANQLPVITTTGAPWSELVQHRCGWWVEPGVLGISKALSDAMACEQSELIDMGKRGRQLVIDKYSWDKVGSFAQEVGAWVLDQDQIKPDAVDIFPC